MPVSRTDVKRLVERAEKGGAVRQEEIVSLLELSDPDLTRLLYDGAARVRARYFGNRVFLYGFLYFSTHCRNNCRFCRYRRANTGVERYRKKPEQILASAVHMAGAGVHLIDLTMGEDPAWHEKGENGFDDLVALAGRVGQRTGLPVMISPGLIPPGVLRRLAAAGIQWYACYQETHNRSLYRALRPGQDYDLRMAGKQAARDAGLLVEEGLLTGVGETVEDIARSVLWMKAFGVDQARVMTFVPQAGTPMAGQPAKTRVRELNTIALMRLILGDCLIPASLDVDGLDGLESRLAAGANVVSSIVPPQQGLAGVANQELDIEDSRRNLDHILPRLAACNLEPADASAYWDWVRRRQAAHAWTPKQAG